MRKRIVILGAGESGTGSAILAIKKGYDVFVSDAGTVRPGYRKILSDRGIEWEEGKHTEKFLLDADEVIKSPGIPDETAIVRMIREQGIPLISEIEFASRFTDAFIIGVTGSNGKTTTTLLISHMLEKAGLNSAAAGNVGKSFAMQVAERMADFYVVELSSFQLDGIISFKPDIAVLMNITPDHLDRYGNDMLRYIDSKFRITKNLTSEDHFVYCADDDLVMKEIAKRDIRAISYPFSMKPRGDRGAWVEHGKLIIKTINSELTMFKDQLALKGNHNTYNSMAAGIAGQILKIRKETIRESLAGFKGVEHRLEPVMRIRGIDFVNDSKATNINSTWYALESMETPVVWIAGGIDKGNDYSMLFDLAGEKVRAIVCLGLDNSRIKSSFTDKVPSIKETGSMEEAVKAAYSLAKKGDTVLLSPACASFDLFENYEDRGMQFKKCVRNL